MSQSKNSSATEQIRRVIGQLVETPSVSGTDGISRSVFPVALNPKEASVLRDWVLREGAAQTLEVGLAFGFSTLHICEALVLGANPDAHHLAIDPHQLAGYASAGLLVLRDAGVADLVEFHSEESQLLLPQFVRQQRRFDFAFVDGNHRFDAVFVDLFFLNRLIKPGGVVAIDDFNLPGIRKAVSFFVTNLSWKAEEIINDRMAVVRTSTVEDSRDFRYFAEF